jgi:hypothetical protein
MLSKFDFRNKQALLLLDAVDRDDRRAYTRLESRFRSRYITQMDSACACTRLLRGNLTSTSMMFSRRRERRRHGPGRACRPRSRAVLPRRRTWRRSFRVRATSNPTRRAPAKASSDEPGSAGATRARRPWTPSARLGRGASAVAPASSTTKQKSFLAGGLAAT